MVDLINTISIFEIFMSLLCKHL